MDKEKPDIKGLTETVEKLRESGKESRNTEPRKKKIVKPKKFRYTGRKR